MITDADTNVAPSSRDRSGEAFDNSDEGLKSAIAATLAGANWQC
jgi:hypothetical protein